MTAPAKGSSDIGYNVKELRAKVGWITRFRPAIEGWTELLRVTELVQDYIRRSGYHRSATTKLKRTLASQSLSRPTREMLKNLLAFTDQQSKKLKTKQPVLGHTEVLESLFGRYKQTQANHSQGGMTGSLLSIGTMTLVHSPEIVQKALEAIKVTDVTKWIETNRGSTVASVRRKMIDSPYQAEQKLLENTTTSKPSF